jgi:hypothetical protein
LIKDIEELFDRTMSKTARSRAVSGITDEGFNRSIISDESTNSIASKYKSIGSLSNESFEDSKKEELKSGRLGQVASKDAKVPEVIEFQLPFTQPVQAP